MRRRPADRHAAGRRLCPLTGCLRGFAAGARRCRTLPAFRSPSRARGARGYGAPPEADRSAKSRSFVSRWSDKGKSEARTGRCDSQAPRSVFGRYADSSAIARSTMPCRSMPSSASTQARSTPSWLKPYVGPAPTGWRSARLARTALWLLRGISTCCVNRGRRSSSGSGVGGSGAPRRAKASTIASRTPAGLSTSGRRLQSSASTRSSGRTFPVPRVAANPSARPATRYQAGFG